MYNAVHRRTASTHNTSANKRVQPLRAAHYRAVLAVRQKCSLRFATTHDGLGT